LEFPVVFLCGLSRSFNTTDATKQVLCHKDLGLGLTFTDTTQRVSCPTIAKRAIAAKIRAESISEELRVLYVAMTRARDRLIMTYAARNLDDQLTDLALRLDLTVRDLITAQVSCPGTWVLLSALQRTEAGAFFNVSAKPDCSNVQEVPWKIQIKEVSDTQGFAEDTGPQYENLSSGIIEKMQKGLAFRYAHTASVSVPSKLTATQLKGRVKDQEAAEFAHTLQTQALSFRSPLHRNQAIRGTEYGNAMHNVMQYIDFNCCYSVEAIFENIAKMEAAGLISHATADVVDTGKIFRFFQSDLGQKVIGSKEVLREFKFSILEDASSYYNDIYDDQILLQGVIDCVLIEEEGITVLDFKTDFITDSNLEDKIAQYKPQVQTYAKALARIYEKPVIHTYLYFFSCEKFVNIH
jgi:ATP-dependent helicase/nuclease subunit A